MARTRTCPQCGGAFIEREGTRLRKFRKRQLGPMTGAGREEWMGPPHPPKLRWLVAADGLSVSALFCSDDCARKTAAEPLFFGAWESGFKLEEA